MQHGWCNRLRRVLTLGVAVSTLMSKPALAGPPFVTDDPEPTEYRHYEIYVASDYSRSHDGVGGTFPHLEINYGALRNVQVTVTLPLAGSQQPLLPMQYGFGDIEFQAKARLAPETDRLPEVSIAPTIDLPTGNASEGLGGGFTKMFFPLWLEKGFGPYTVYGGGGLWRNAGDDNRNYIFSGIAVERDFGRGFTLGTEIYGQSADTRSGRGSVGFNVGAVKGIDDRHKFLVSVGRGLRGSNTFSAYAAYGLTFGPHEEPAAKDAADDAASAKDASAKNDEPAAAGAPGAKDNANGAGPAKTAPEDSKP